MLRFLHVLEMLFVNSLLWVFLSKTKTFQVLSAKIKTILDFLIVDLSISKIFQVLSAKMKTILDFLIVDMSLCSWSKNLFFTFLNFTLFISSRKLF